ncbi:MAG TPA: hypothetical protein VHY18_07310 [Solirubrobacteraceae bacterium]|jgi:hypothetical protein|nr:hypothetical protein [Solirubrobacteraceae bacterium]
MSWWRATLSAGLLVVGLQIFAVEPAGARHFDSPPGDSVALGHTESFAATGSSTATGHSLPRNAHAMLVQRSPFGLSFEYPLMEKALGPGACPSPALVATLRELGSPSLRIGGDSQDLAGPTAAYRYFIPPSFWTALGCLARQSGVQVTVGLNFATSPLADELTTIAAAEQAIPAAQLSFSLGNEPDLYGISHIFPDEPGVTIPAFRPSPWTAEEYASEWQSRRAMLGQVRIEGPDLAGIGWDTALEPTLSGDPPDVLDVHAYPTSACGAPLTTAARLLIEHASVGLVEKYSWLLNLAHTLHRPAIVSESNSASCGGKPGVSNTPVAGVWAARYVVAALLGGFQQVRFHSAGGSYDPLVFNANGTVTLQPLGQALLFLHRWIPLGSRIGPAARVPGVLAAVVSDGRHTNTIVSSFSSKPLTYEVGVTGVAARVRSETLSTSSSGEAGAWVTVRAHRARLRLAPNTVVAIGAS